MTPLEHAVVINRPLASVYALAREVERYPDFLPGYVESRILERLEGRLLLFRRAVVRGRLHEWKSWVTFLPSGAIRFEHAAGPLKGTQVDWIFSAEDGMHTQLKIRHAVCSERLGVAGWFLEKWFFVPRIREMAEAVVLAFKKACERT